MMKQAYNTQQDVVKDLRKIREVISSEIKDMTFDEERAWLNKLLADKERACISKTISTSEAPGN